MTENRPIFIGRPNKLHNLHQYLKYALDGKSQVVFIEGESGTGKTALVHEFLSIVNSRYPQVRCGVGACFGNNEQIGFSPS